MATYDTLERSTEESKPLEVYNFSLGGESFLYTSAEDEVTVGVDTYKPESISRNAVALGEDERSRLLEVTVPLTNTFAGKYLNIPPGIRASCTVIRLQRDETPTFSTQELSFKGFVQSVRFPDESTAVIGVQSIEAATSRTIPRFAYQGLCNHMLYDDQCQADPDLFSIKGAVVTAEVDNTITVAGAAASGFDFTAGYVKPNGVNDFRLVLAQSGDVLTLLLPFSVSVLGLTADVFAGCDHVISGDCLNVFDNVPRHGGFFIIPKKNPFQTGVQT